MVNIAKVTNWDDPPVCKSILYTSEDDRAGAPAMCDAYLAVPRITCRLENPLRSTLMDLEELKAKLRSKKGKQYKVHLEEAKHFPLAKKCLVPVF